MISEHELNWIVDEDESNRQFSEPFLRTGYLEVLPLPNQFTDIVDYTSTPAQSAARARARARNSRRALRASLLARQEKRRWHP